MSQHNTPLQNLAVAIANLAQRGAEHAGSEQLEYETDVWVQTVDGYVVISINRHRLDRVTSPPLAMPPPGAYILKITQHS